MYLVIEFFFIAINHLWSKSTRFQATDLVLPRLCTHIILSVQNGSFKHSYVSLIIDKRLYKHFLDQSKSLVTIVLGQLESRASLGLKLKDEYYKFEIFLNFLSVMGNCSRWKCFREVTGEKATGFANSNKLVETMLNETTKTYLLLMQSEGEIKLLMFNFLY